MSKDHLEEMSGLSDSDEEPAGAFRQYKSYQVFNRFQKQDSVVNRLMKANHSISTVITARPDPFQGKELDDLAVGKQSSSEQRQTESSQPVGTKSFSISGKFGLTTASASQSRKTSQDEAQAKVKVPVVSYKQTQIQKQPFDFRFIRVLIKKSTDKESQEVLLEREWVTRNQCIPHFCNVVAGVKEQEGVEITMNCNPDAFHWIIDLLRTKTGFEDMIEEHRHWNREKISNLKVQMGVEIKEKIGKMTAENCLNVLVTSYFLQITWLYEQVWSEYFVPNFCEVIN